MKRLLFLLSFLMVVAAANAQYYYVPNIGAGTNPGGLNTDDEYPNGGGLDASWTMILGGNQTSPAWSPAQTLPFPFQFNGAAVTSYTVSSSGILTFAATPGTAPTSTPATLPNAAIPDSSVCIWGLEAPGANDNIMVKTFGTAPNRQHWVFFASYMGNGGSGDWFYWSIVLEETSNKIYIVDQRASSANAALTLGIQIDATSAVMVAGSPNIANNATTDPTPADNSYYEFIPGSQPAVDMGVTNLTIPAFLDNNNAPFSITGEVTNFGSDTVTSFDLNYIATGGTVVTANITGVSIPMYDTYTFTHPTAWSPASGNYDLKVYTAITGDANGLNDTMMTNVTVLDTIIAKKVVLEEGTGAWCGFCPDGAVVVEDILSNHPEDVIAVAIHNGDAMAFPDGNTVNSAYANGYPNGWVDRFLFPGASTVGQSRSLWAQMVTDRLAMPVPISVEATTSYAARVLTINLDAKFYAAMSGDYRINAYILEDSLVGQGQGWDQSNYYNTDPNHPMGGLGNPIVGYVHDHVLREMLGGPWGTQGIIPATVTAGQNFTHTYTYNVPQSVNPNRLTVVVLVQKYATDMNDREILNAEQYHLGFIDAVEEINADNALSVYPNPTTNTAYVTYSLTNNANVNFDLYSITGELVSTMNYGVQAAGEYTQNIDVANLSQGMYILKATIDGQVITKKISVQ